MSLGPPLHSWSSFTLSCPGSPGIFLFLCASHHLFAYNTSAVPCFCRIFILLFKTSNFIWMINSEKNLFWLIKLWTFELKICVCSIYSVHLWSWCPKNITCYLFLHFAVRKTHDNSTSIDISRTNSFTDELDYMTEDIPLPVVTDRNQ